MKPNPFVEAKESALRLLARREYGANELKQRLLQKGYEVAIAEQVIQLFIELDLQSDERYVESYIRRRSAKGFGPLHLCSALSKAGISSDIIKNVLIHYNGEWVELIKQLNKKKFNASGFLKDKYEREKQIKFFQSRGFELIQIREALS